MSKSKHTKNDRLKDYIDLYVKETGPGGTNIDELEIRFGTNWWRPITKIDFDNVIKRLKSLGWTSNGSADYHMNVQSQLVSLTTGKTTIGNIRTEIQGINAIQKYCKNNSIGLDDLGISYLQKTTKIYKKGTPDEERLLPYRL